MLASTALVAGNAKRGGCWKRKRDIRRWRLGVKYDHLRSANKVGLSWHYRSSRKAKMLSSSLPPSTLAKKGVWNEVFLYESMGLSFPVGCDPLSFFFLIAPIFITSMDIQLQHLPIHNNFVPAYFQVRALAFTSLYFLVVLFSQFSQFYA